MYIFCSLWSFVVVVVVVGGGGSGSGGGRRRTGKGRAQREIDDDTYRFGSLR